MPTAIRHDVPVEAEQCGRTRTLERAGVPVQAVVSVVPARQSRPWGTPWCLVNVGLYSVSVAALFAPVVVTMYTSFNLVEEDGWVLRLIMWR